MPLNDIVNVVITRQTQSVTEQGFGTPMILGTHTRFTDRIRFYSDMEEVAVDFKKEDLEYRAAQDIFSQEISPNRIAMGRRKVLKATVQVNAAMTDQTYTLLINNIDISFTSSSTPGVLPEDIALGLKALVDADATLPVTAETDGAGLITLEAIDIEEPWSLDTETSIEQPNNSQVSISQVYPGQEYFVKLNNLEYSYVAPLDVQTADQIAESLVNLINTVPQAVEVTAENNDDGTFDVTSIDPLENFSISVSPEKMAIDDGLIIKGKIPAKTITEDLTAINEIDNSWYALILADRDKATVLEAAEWIETMMKIFGTVSDDPKTINLAVGSDTGANKSIAAELSQLGRKRTFVMYHQDALTDFPEAAWFGRVLPLEPGSETWKFKNLNGISSSKLTTNQSNNVMSKNANTYEFVAGVGITAEGTMANGEYIDIIRGIDWLTSRIQEFVFRVLVNNDKIAYTDAGIATIQAEVMRVLSLGVGNNFLASDPAPLVTVPLASDVPSVDKSNRILKNVKFSATLAGAVHSVQIRGLISV